MAMLNEPPAHRALRAEIILFAAIAVVSVLVVALSIILWNGQRVHDREDEVVAKIRAARAEILTASQAQGDAEAISARFIATQNAALLTEFDEAKASARQHLAAARPLIAGDEEILSHISRLQELTERRFNILDAEIASRGRGLSGPRQEATIYNAFRAETDAIFALFNGRIDAARAAENNSREQLNLVAIALAALSLIASALAILAVRRERDQWRLAADAAEEARASANAANLAKSRFLAVASHDMRQPLHALTLYLSALERRVESAEARDIIEKMDRATQSMIGMFSTLLDLARVQAGVVKPEIVEADLQSVFDRIAAEHPSDRVEITPTRLAVRTDPLLLERVLANLTVNAIKHGGGKAQLRAREVGGRVEIEVSDDGPGIPAEDQQRVFDEFVRLGSRADGLGLGLAIVRNIARLLDMPVELRSQPGHGVTFLLQVPRAAPPAITAQQAAASPSFDGVSVLVLDDDALAREAMAGALRDLGALVHECADEDGVDAAIASGLRPRLLVMDLRINGEIKGFDITARALAKLDVKPSVIIVTGDTGPETLAELRASGHAWLIKPVDPRDLAVTAAAQIRT